MAAGQPALQFLPASRLFPVVPGYLAAIATRLLNYIQLPKLQCTRAVWLRGRTIVAYYLRATFAPLVSSLQAFRGNFEKYASERIAAIPQFLSAVICEFASFWRRK